VSFYNDNSGVKYLPMYRVTVCAELVIWSWLYAAYWLWLCHVSYQNIVTQFGMCKQELAVGSKVP